MRPQSRFTNEPPYVSCTGYRDFLPDAFVLLSGSALQLMENPQSGGFLRMEPDGNLVMYAGTPQSRPFRNYGALEPVVNAAAASARRSSKPTAISSCTTRIPVLE